MRRFVLTIVGAMLMAGGVIAPACADDDSILGMGIGAAVGGLFGSQFGHGAGHAAATGLGIVTGGLIGSNIGHSIEADNAQAYSASNPYTIYSEPAPFAYNAYAPNYVAPPAPPPTYVDQNAGTFCRPFSQTILIDGRAQES